MEVIQRILLIHLLYSYLQNIDLYQLNSTPVFQTYMVRHCFLRCLHVRYLDRFGEALLLVDLSFYPTRKYDFWKHETKINLFTISILAGRYFYCWGLSYSKLILKFTSERSSAKTEYKNKRIHLKESIFSW